MKNAKVEMLQKVFTKESVAKGVATKKSNATGKVFMVFPVDGGFIVAQPETKEGKPQKVTKEAKKPVEMVSAQFPFVGEDGKYLVVSVRDKKYKIAKSRTNYQVDGDVVQVEMTAQYAGHRPELSIH